MSKKNGKYIKCKICNKQFYISKKRYNTAKFCSNKCKNKNAIQRMKNNTWGFQKGFIPWNKNTKGIMKPNSGSFKKGQTGSKNINWKNGKYYHSEGYIFIYCPNHPNRKTKLYQLEHRLIAEKILGRYLTLIEVIHHINGIKDDNRPENLYLFTSKSKHITYHLLVKNNKIKPITKSNL